MPDFPEGYTSYEAWIESMAGASPRDAKEWDERYYEGTWWPLPKPPPYEADDEDEATPGEDDS